MNNRTPMSVVMLALLATAGCGADGNGVATTTGKALPGETAASSPGKLQAPVTLDYQVLGTPIIGQPVAIELQISSALTDMPVTMSYFINDTDSMLFPESQARQINVSIPDEAQATTRQVTVVPQREGRLYLNVTAEIDVDGRRMLRSMSVPIVVGQGGAAPESNGRLTSGADGEALVSLPAREY